MLHVKYSCQRLIKHMIFLCVILAGFFVSPPVFAQQQFDYTAFSQIPLSHQGRVKPLGRVAQLTIQDISGIKLSAPQASAWLATLLFDPQSADTPPVFLIRNPHIIHALGLESPASPDAAYYNFQTLNAAFTAKADLVMALRNSQENALQKDQQELLSLYAQVTFYEQLKNALTLLLPLKDAPYPRLIDKPATQQISGNLGYILKQGELNQLFRVIPFQAMGAASTWVSPWEYWLQNRTIYGDQTRPPILLQQWSDLAQSYLHGDEAAWQKISGQLLHQTFAQAASTQAAFKLLPYQIQADLLYNILDPYFYSLCFYIAAFFMALLALKYPAPLVKRATWSIFIGGLSLHIFGIMCRVFILQRPPVSNLYESILFVGALLTAMGLWYIHRKREAALLPPLALLAAALQLLGFALDHEGDSLQVLQAVLDTKFWLAIHVMTITAGYALCLVTALLAHAALFISVRYPALPLHTHRFYKRAFYFSLLSLLFVSIGTLLGGVWADQSWGRFWGWDPKENGALLIVLWLVWLLHGRISQHFSDRAFMIGLALLNIIVGISWIGVNLLGIGLHSYGFISGSVVSLLMLVLAEILFFGFCGLTYLRHKTSQA